MDSQAINLNEKLILACSRGGKKGSMTDEAQLSSVEQLLALGADPSYKESSALKCAVLFRCPHLFSLLLSHGANPNDKAYLDGEEKPVVSIFFLAACMQYPADVLDMFMLYGADAKKTDAASNALSNLCEYVFEPTLPKAGGRSAKAQREKERAAHSLVDLHHNALAQTVDYMISKGAKPDFVNSRGVPLAQQALLYGSQPVYNLLQSRQDASLKTLLKDLEKRYEEVKAQRGCRLNLCLLMKIRKKEVGMCRNLDPMFTGIGSLSNWQRWAVETITQDMPPWTLDAQDTVLIELKPGVIKKFRPRRYVWAHNIPPFTDYFWLEPLESELFEYEIEEFRAYADQFR